MLHTLNNRDKHRLITVVGAIPTGGGVSRPPGIDCSLEWKLGTFHDGAEIGSLTLLSGTDLQVAMDRIIGVNMEVSLVFAHPGMPLRSFLHNLHGVGWAVDHVLTSFDAVLGPHPDRPPVPPPT